MYRSKGFRSLDPYLRAQLILVREGVKSGAELDEQDQDCCSKEIDHILKDLRLNFTKSRWRKRFCYRVSLEPSVLDVRQKDKSDQMFAVRVFGYPSCCARRYQAIYNRYDKTRKEGQTPAEVFARQQEALGRVPKENLWIDFFPCHPLCREAASKGRTYRTILEKYDREAARAWKEPSTLLKVPRTNPPLLISIG